MKKISLYIKNQEGLSEDFQSTELKETSTYFSKYKIMKDLEDMVIIDLMEKQRVEDTYLVDYTSSGDRHCIFDLLDEKRISEDEYEFLYEYTTTIS